MAAYSTFADCRQRPKLKAHVFELQYADDAALPSHTASGLQQNLDSLTDCYQRAGLVISVNKTEVLAQVSAAQTSVTSTFSIAGSILNNVHQFTYLGSILTEDCDLTNEINYCIKLSAAAFGQLSQRVFLNHNLTVATKVSVYHAICLSILVYGCESWTLYRHHVKALEAHHIKCLQSILGVQRWHKVHHAEIWRKAYLECIESWIMQRQLRWLRHVIRMPSYRLPRRLLYGALQQGQRSAGGQKKRFSIHIQETLKKCGTPPEQLEVLASDRTTWHTTCNQGLTIFHSNYAADAESRHARKHAASTSSSGTTCHVCSRVCASDFGLRSHLRSHTRLTSSTTSSS